MAGHSEVVNLNVILLSFDLKLFISNYWGFLIWFPDLCSSDLYKQNVLHGHRLLITLFA